MKELFIHVLAQSVYILAFTFGQVTVSLFNILLEYVGVNYKDSHVELGVYIMAFFILAYPVGYYIFCEIFLANRISKYINIWFFRLECLALLFVGMLTFFT